MADKEVMPTTPLQRAEHALAWQSLGKYSGSTPKGTATSAVSISRGDLQWLVDRAKRLDEIEASLQKQEVV